MLLVEILRERGGWNNVIQLLRLIPIIIFKYSMTFTPVIEFKVLFVNIECIFFTLYIQHGFCIKTKKTIEVHTVK